MKSIVKVVLGTMLAASFLVGCKTTSSFKKEDKPVNEAKGFTNPAWTLGGRTPSKVMVGQTVVFKSDINTSIIPEGSNVNIEINYDNEGSKGMVELLSATVENGRISREWKVKDNPSFYKDGVYTVPKYSFNLSADNGNKSTESTQINAYGYIRTQVSGKDGELKKNQDVVIYKSDNTTLKVKTDAEGYIDLKWLPFGAYSFEMLKPAAAE